MSNNSSFLYIISDTYEEVINKKNVFELLLKMDTISFEFPLIFIMIIDDSVASNISEVDAHRNIIRFYRDECDMYIFDTVLGLNSIKFKEMNRNGRFKDLL